LMKKEKDKFFKGALKKGYKRSTVEALWNFMEKFASYGFNKPHSASYALIAYWTAYIKANYPVEFMTALLTAELQGMAGPQREIKMSQAIEECRRMKIEVLLPDINKSFASFRIEGPSIRFGLSAIKNVGEAAIEAIVSARKDKKFISFRDFLSRVDLRRVNKKTVESLIKANAFSKFGNRASLLSYYPQTVLEIQKNKIKKEKGQFDLFKNEKDNTITDDFKELPEFNEEEIYIMEREIIGFLLTKNPLAKFAPIIKKKVNKKIGNITFEDVDKPYILAGIIGGKRLLKTRKNNHDMAVIQVFDETGSIEVVVFPTTFEKLKNIIAINRIIMLKGKVNEREGRLGIIMENAVDLETVKTVN